MSSRQSRLVFAYRPEGFQHLGGLRRIAEEAVRYFCTTYPRLELATLSSNPHGKLSSTKSCTTIQRNDQLLIVGCDIPWAYALALRARLQGLSVAWMPSFHDPNYALHPFRARMAQAVLRLMQWFGVVVYVQTEYELRLLCVAHLLNCRLSGHGWPINLRVQFTAPDHQEALLLQSSDRPIDLLFFGRPTEQKGWSCFVTIAKMSGLRCEAIVPFLPAAGHEIHIHCKLTDDGVTSMLRQAKILILPSIYESFGIAQLEALLAGCLVPILGNWPFWERFDLLQWQNLEIAAIVRHCNALARDPLALHSLWFRQIAYIRNHPSLSYALFPDLGCFER
jgi:glycosyltransferase involved in cell wall biosynthesis